MPTPPALDRNHAAVLHPAVGEAAHRTGATAIALVVVGCAAGFDLTLDLVGITYDTGQTLGDPDSPVQVAASVVGREPVPDRELPAVVARFGIGVDPLDLRDEEDVHRLRSRHEPSAGLDAQIALTAAAAPELLRGRTLDLLPEALERVPTDTLPVVTTAWTLRDLSLEDRLRFLHRLDDAATHRTVAWVSVEGVGVAPGVPTMGDRRASGHSTIGLTVFQHASTHAEALGRSWSQGRRLRYRPRSGAGGPG